MKKTILTLLILVLVGMLFFWSRKTTQYQPLTNTLIIGTSADFPPFSFRDRENNITGFDIDIVKEVARRMGYTPDIQDRPFTTLLPQLQLGQIHIIAAGMTATPQRAKSVNFSQTYLINNPLLVVSLASGPEVNSLDDLKNKTVLVNTGYTADLYMSKIPDLNILRLSKVPDALNALDAHKGDAFVTAALTLKPYLQELDKNKTKYRLFTIQETDENTALAISKVLPEKFVQEVNSTLESMQQDGTIDSLKNKWGII